MVEAIYVLRLLILAWICLIQVPVLVASPGVSPFFFQLEFSLELVSMYSICLDITTIYPMRAWRTSSANQPKRKWREPSLYCAGYQACFSTSRSYNPYKRHLRRNRDRECRSPRSPTEGMTRTTSRVQYHSPSGDPRPSCVAHDPSSSATSFRLFLSAYVISVGDIGRSISRCRRYYYACRRTLVGAIPQTRRVLMSVLD